MENQKTGASACLNKPRYGMGHIPGIGMWYVDGHNYSSFSGKLYISHSLSNPASSSLFKSCIRKCVLP